MPELIIKYKSKKTLQALLDFAKHFNFSIVLPSNSKEKTSKINGVSIISGDSTIDTSELEVIFSSKSIDAKDYRKRAWQRINN